MQKNKIEVVHTRVFAAEPAGGNPCPVVTLADRLSTAQMQELARIFALDTAFILHPESNDAHIRLRFFVPDHEMGVSGHATIAAITVARTANILKSDCVQVETINGEFEVQLAYSNKRILVTLEQNKPVLGPPVKPNVVAKVLNIPTSKILVGPSPVQSVSVSRPKLVVPLRDSSVLGNLAPNYEAVWKLCDKLKVTGFYPFTRRTDKRGAQVEARQFPLRAGFVEDAATGIAAGALGAYLAIHDLRCRTGQHVFRIAQGYAMGAPSLIEAIVECREGEVSRTAIRGTAEVVGREPVSVPQSGDC